MATPIASVTATQTLNEAINRTFFAPQINWLMMTGGLLLFILSIAILMSLGKRSFLRRNSHAVEEFESWGHMVRTNLAEMMLRFVGFVICLTGMLFTLMSFLSPAMSQGLMLPFRMLLVPFGIRL